MPKRPTMKEIDHTSPFANELTSVWHRGEEERPEETDDDAEAIESGERSDPAETPADD